MLEARLSAAFLGALCAAIVAALVVLAARLPDRVPLPRHPDTVAHCLRGELGPGRVSHFEPCQRTQIFGAT